MTKDKPLKTEYRNVADLVPYARNARTHSDEQVSRIAASIREFGWTNPILIGDDDTVIAGHGRLAAAKKLGMTEVPTIRLSGLTKEQLRAYVLVDNRLAEDAGWDKELLGLELSELKDSGFDLDLIGFSSDEIDQMIAGVEEHPTMKPVKLFRYLMENSSKAGDIVLDSFGGSGTTLVAAEELGRKARLMELDPRYCDVIIKRWQAMTGKDAVREDGKTYNSLA